MICISSWKCWSKLGSTLCPNLYENRYFAGHSIFIYILSKNKNDKTHIFLAKYHSCWKKMQHLFICVGFCTIFCCTRTYKIYSSCDRVQIYRENLQFIITSLWGYASWDATSRNDYTSLTLLISSMVFLCSWSAIQLLYSTDGKVW